MMPLNLKSKIKLNSLLTPSIIFVLAFSIRLIYLNQIKTGPLFIPSEVTLDEYLYDSWAKEIAFKDPLGKTAFWGLPLYPYFLALIYFILGPSAYIARLIQFIIGSLNCCLIYIIGKKVFDKPIGIISGILLSLYNASIFYEGFLIASSLTIFFACFLILGIISFKEKPNYKKSITQGVALGLTALTMPSIFLFIPFLILLYRRHLRLILISVVFCFLVILPVTIRNYILEKDLIPITAHNGITFYAGNNPKADGSFKLPIYLGTDVTTIRDNSKAIAEKAMNQKLKPSQVSSFWVKKGLEFINQQPLAYLKLLFRKFLLFWNHYEVSDIYDMNFFKRFAPLLKFPLVNFTVISIFSLIGLFLSLKQRTKNHLLIQMFILSNLISLMLYFVNTRYRLPVVPFLILFASYGIYNCYNWALKKQYKRLLCFAGGLIILYLVGSLKLIEPSPEVAYTNLGVFYYKKGKYAESIKEYKQALELEPCYPLAHNNLGIAYKKLGETDGAIREYKTAIKLNPDFSSPYYNLGILYMDQGHFPEAIENLTEALSINPNLAGAHKKIAACYEAIGDSEKAAYHLSQPQK